MELLRPTKTAALVALPLFLVSACWFALGPGSEYHSRFPHAKHVSEQGMECTLCHAGAESEDVAGMPSMDACALCHEFLDEEKPEEHRLATIFAGVEGEIPRAMVPLSDEVVFAHSTHAAAGVDCASCHGAVEGMDSRVQFVAMDSCIACHQERGRTDTCATCHTKIDQDTPPPSHSLSWRTLHGPTALARDPAMENRCALCHEESVCSSCHESEAPRDHTQFWRRQGHGIALDMDRERCITCHQPSQCQSCHEVAEPRSHHAGFGAPRQGHCASCHLPGDDDGCATCHTGPSSHELAAPMPDNHHPGFDCRQCHGLTAPLPHVDGGAACSLCHR